MIDAQADSAGSQEPTSFEDEAIRLIENRERQLRQAIASAPLVVFITDRSGNLTLIEGEGLHALGIHTSEGLINLLEAVSDLPEFKESLQKALGGESLKTLITSRAGRVFEMALSPVTSVAGAINGTVGIGIDITPHRRIEEALLSALRRTNELYQVSRTVALARTPDEVLRALMAGDSLSAAHRATILLFDAPWEENAPESITAIAEWERAPSHVKRVGATWPVAGHNLAALYRRDGPNIIRVGDSRLSPEQHDGMVETDTQTLMLFPLIASGTWYGMLTVHSPHDDVPAEALTHLQSLVDTLAASIYTVNLLKTEALARKEAERANYMKMRLLGTISHELRTPLTSIKGFAATLLAKDVRWDAQSQVDFIETIAEEADKMTDLVGHLLDLTRLESGTLRIDLEPTTVEGIVAVAHSQLITTARHHHLTLDIPDDLPIVQADTHRIAQVVVNLVNNAVKYSPHGTEIRLSAHRDGDFVCVRVRDHGGGIPEDERERIFEAFHQVSGTPSGEKSGVGLGLAISRGIVDAHGGRIWVAESDSRGSTFSFTLPQSTEDVLAELEEAYHAADDSHGNGRDDSQPDDMASHADSKYLQ